MVQKEISFRALPECEVSFYILLAVPINIGTALVLLTLKDYCLLDDIHPLGGAEVFARQGVEINP